MAIIARPCLMFVLVSLVGSCAIGQDDKNEPRASTSGSSWRSDSRGWTRTSNYEVTGYADRPDARVLNSVTVHWELPEIDPLGNTCTVRGQLRIPTGDRENTKPIEWFRGVIVYVARQPYAVLNWSNGTNEKDTLERTRVVSGLGRFQVSIDLRDIERDRELEQSFQFGLALAEHEAITGRSERVVWSSQTPVEASTIQMLSVPAAPQLSREIELINQAGGWPYSNRDGTALIRAVNALRKLGKERALLALEDYIHLTDENYDYNGDQETVFWIIRLLFEPILLDDSIPPPAIYLHLIDHDSADFPMWPLNPIDRVEDIPFMVGIQTAGSGMPEHPSSHIEWARRHGVIRDEPLRPTKHPLAAAEQLLRSKKFSRLHEQLRGIAVTSIRSQALAMIPGILEPLPDIRHDAPERQAHWEARLREADRLGITWDVEMQSFVVSSPAR
ncbi:MAG: hypothetical protein H8E66_20945 [Planctomycetes bacterium]|nr:hypothetical protein [Planctomycetota bacterium]